MQQVRLKSGSERATPTVMPFQIRGRSFTAVVLQMTGAVDADFYAALDAKLAQAPHFFTNAPFVLDLDGAVGLGRSGDFTGLVRELRARKLAVIGVQNGTIEQNAAALTAGLITLQGGREAPQDRGEAPERTAQDQDARNRTDRVAAATEAAGPAVVPPPAEPATGETLLVTEPVRSGQRIFADRGDLVVVTSVGSGAELIAHGNIHVYGSLRGRALAGVNGDRNARIFCQSLEAELIAIAGLYKTSDDLGPSAWRQRIQAFLDDDVLYVEALK